MNREPAMPDEDLLSAYLDGECTDDERARVEGQLASSADLRLVLDDVAAARDAVRALPSRDAPPEFWARLLATDVEPQFEGGEASPEAVATTAPVDLAAHRSRTRGRPGRWLAAAGGAAAAAVIAVIALMPAPESVTPPVATFTDAHAVRTSLQDDAVSSLAPLAVQAGFRR